MPLTLNLTSSSYLKILF